MGMKMDRTRLGREELAESWRGDAVEQEALGRGSWGDDEGNYGFLQTDVFGFQVMGQKKQNQEVKEELKGMKGTKDLFSK